jgi:hypothetical protein
MPGHAGDDVIDVRELHWLEGHRERRCAAGREREDRIPVCREVIGRVGGTSPSVPELMHVPITTLRRHLVAESQENR